MIHLFKHPTTDLPVSTNPSEDPLYSFCHLFTYFAKPSLIFGPFAICITCTLIIKHGDHSLTGPISLPISGQPQSPQGCLYGQVPFICHPGCRVEHLDQGLVQVEIYADSITHFLYLTLHWLTSPLFHTHINI